MIIAYETEFLRELCLKAEAAEKHFGIDLAASFFAVLADIYAAEMATELFMGAFFEQEGVADPFIQIHFGGSGTITLVNNHPKRSGRAPERVDWSQVRRLRIVEISHHGD